MPQALPSVIEPQSSTPVVDVTPPVEPVQTIASDELAEIVEAPTAVVVPASQPAESSTSHSPMVQQRSETNGRSKSRRTVKASVGGHALSREASDKPVRPSRPKEKAMTAKVSTRSKPRTTSRKTKREVPQGLISQRHMAMFEQGVIRLAKVKRQVLAVRREAELQVTAVWARLQSFPPVKAILARVD